jgi:acyl-CoA reductase-like NAD-dependent aldehyde dehydrogenase
MTKIKTTIAILTMLAIGAFASADTKQTAGINVGADLPPKLRALLIQEMQAIDTASQQIHAAIVQGHHETIARQAQAIHDSFIMAQKMTPADEAALLAAVPKGFLASDEELHELSATLAEAGRARDTARQMQLFSAMTKGCVDCHREYATARFPGLASGNY